MKPAVQLSSFCPMMKTEQGAVQVLEKLAALGCDTVQLRWPSSRISVDFLIGEMERLGIRAVSVLETFPDLLRDPHYYHELIRKCGCEEFCVSGIPSEYGSLRGLEAYARRLGRLITLMRTDGGLIVSLHPLAENYRPVEGIDPVGFLLEKLNGKLTLCADTTHMTVGGLDPAEAILRYAPFVSSVHFKDFVRREGGVRVPVPAGQGEICTEKLRSICAESGVLYGYAEQERWRSDPYQELAAGYRWVEKGCI